MNLLWRVLRAIPVCLVMPAVSLTSWLALVLTDLLWSILGSRRLTTSTLPRSHAASIVIPNWNGRDLLEKYLPSVITAMAGHPDHEVIVVDNGSTDGSAEFLAQAFPSVRVLALPKNRGFGGGSNAGVQAAKNDIVVLLNSDMRVEPDFLEPLLQGFRDDAEVFAVSCQIFFSDPHKKREETGLTQGWWENGGLRVRHRIDEEVDCLFPCFYGGGGSCAFDRRKFLELGGFDEILAPFYLEDTDLGYMAWKRGWKVLYQPASRVFHEHRGTIGKKFSQAFINGVLKKNFYLFCWKNIHEPSRLWGHVCWAYLESAVSLVAGESPERATFVGLLRACSQLPSVLAARWKARTLSAIPDDEAFKRPLGGYFRDRFLAPSSKPERPSVLFVAPYPICPPVHGGAVFMYHSIKEMAQHVPLHVICLLDQYSNVAAHAELDQVCASTQYITRLDGKNRMGSILPHAVNEFANDDLEWMIHRTMLMKDIDVLQLDYTNMGQYRLPFHRLVCALFEHDVYFQSIARGLRTEFHPVALWEYLRAFRYELRLLKQFDQVQVCTPANRDYLLSFDPALEPMLRPGLRAGVPVSQYRYRAAGRQPKTMLFLGSFRHLPNQVALDWFLRWVMPLVLTQEPEAKLVIIGSDPPPQHGLPGSGHNVELIGFVEDIRQPLAEYSVFVCPILTGSGVRVKLLEAFASGIPVVSTPIGAEGLATEDGATCRLTDTPEAFAQAVVELLRDPESAAAMAARAYEEVRANWDTPVITRRLIDGYREILERKSAGVSTHG